MYVMSTFDHSIYLELALAALEMENIPKENMLAVPLDKRKEYPRLLDTIHRSDGTSLVDIGASTATAFSVIGASVGFRLVLGPIIWGIIGAVVGFALGFLIDLGITAKKRKKKSAVKGKTPELILIIRCGKEQVELVEAILWKHLALGVAKLDFAAA